MSRYVDLRGVRTWYDERGAGELLVMLHPGSVDSRAFAPNIDAMASRFHVFTPDRRGHGRTPDVPGPITFELMAEDTIRFIEEVVGTPTRLLAMSDGAIVALLVAMHRPNLVSRFVFIAGAFHHDGWLPGVIDPSNQPPDFMADFYGGVSPDGRDHFSVVAKKLAKMHQTQPALTADDLSKVAIRTLVMMGDDDEVKIEHAIAMYRALPNAELAVISGTSHGLLVEKPELCNTVILDFLCKEPVPTLAPIRRAKQP